MVDSLEDDFNAEYQQMLEDMFGWPWTEPPEDYVPLETLPPTYDIPKRSAHLMTAT